MEEALPERERPHWVPADLAERKARCAENRQARQQADRARNRAARQAERDARQAERKAERQRRWDAATEQSRLEMERIQQRIQADIAARCKCHGTSYTTDGDTAFFTRRILPDHIRVATRGGHVTNLTEGQWQDYTGSERTVTVQCEIDGAPHRIVIWCTLDRHIEFRFYLQ